MLNIVIANPVSDDVPLQSVIAKQSLKWEIPDSIYPQTHCFQNQRMPPPKDKKLYLKCKVTK